MHFSHWLPHIKAKILMAESLARDGVHSLIYWSEEKKGRNNKCFGRQTQEPFHARKWKSLEKDIIFCISAHSARGSAAPVFEQGQVHYACPLFEEHWKIPGGRVSPITNGSVGEEKGPHTGCLFNSWKQRPCRLLTSWAGLTPAPRKNVLAVWSQVADFLMGRTGGPSLGNFSLSISLGNG